MAKEKENLLCEINIDPVFVSYNLWKGDYQLKFHSFVSIRNLLPDQLIMYIEIFSQLKIVKLVKKLFGISKTQLCNAQSKDMLKSLIF